MTRQLGMTCAVRHPDGTLYRVRREKTSDRGWQLLLSTPALPPTAGLMWCDLSEREAIDLRDHYVEAIQAGRRPLGAIPMFVDKEEADATE